MSAKFFQIHGDDGALSAGYDGNLFRSRRDALETRDGLLAMGPEWTGLEVVEITDADAAAHPMYSQYASHGDLHD